MTRGGTNADAHSLMGDRDWWALGLPNPCHSRDPRLLLWRIRHRLSGPRRGCSCSRCFDHPGRRVAAQQVYDLRRKNAELREALRRSAFVAEHLMQLIDRETWRASGGDDGQGHYEGDYREEQTFEEIQRWKAIAG